METVAALAEAVRGFSGAVVLVSHDVWFMRVLIEEGMSGEGEGGLDGGREPGEGQAGELWVVGGGRVKLWDREEGLTAYVEKVMKGVIQKGQR
jgi:ATPase subunit of ABC transporter with duplicated ATPase domains